MNLITIAGQTLNLVHLTAIQWPTEQNGRTGALLYFASPNAVIGAYTVVLDPRETEALRWYLARLYRPIDVEAAFDNWLTQQEPQPQPAPVEVDVKAFMRP